MSELHVIVLGVGDAFSALHRPSALLLCCDDVYLAIDCPDMFRSALRAAALRSGRPLDLARIGHVLITHVHGDHMGGLEGFAFYKHFSEGKRVHLLCSPDVRASIWDHRLKASMGTLWDGTQLQSMPFEAYFDHLELPWDQPLQLGPYRLQARRTVHHVPTSALLVQAAGRTLGYSCDTAFDPSLLAFLQPADLIIHETGPGPAHTPYGELAALPSELRTRMRLIHYPDWFDADSSAIPVLQEGDVLHV